MSKTGHEEKTHIFLEQANQNESSRQSADDEYRLLLQEEVT
jgi:hypothetical protein